MTDRLEAPIKAEVVDLLTKAGFMVERMQAGTARGGKMRLGSTGAADLHVVGLNAWIETKRTRGGVVRMAQKLWHERARRHGARVAVVRSAQEALELCLCWRGEDEEKERLVAEQRALERTGLA